MTSRRLSLGHVQSRKTGQIHPSGILKTTTELPLHKMYFQRFLLSSRQGNAINAITNYSPCEIILQSKINLPFFNLFYL